VLAGGILAYLAIFVGLGAVLYPTATAETLLIRGFGTLALVLLHVILCIIVQFRPTEGSWQWFPVFLIDLPFSMLLMFLGYLLPGWAVFGIFGTLWWYLVGALIRYYYRKFAAKPD